ncbi:MAG TPA: LysR family transcriptional regulator [Rhodanobacteraceae bacterium]|nr:LysR family transcriptional regulator [Rhodanobacteraceae bacterium]
MELLDDMALFVEVARRRGFRLAGDATGLPSSTVSRRIARLEKALGLRLLHRTTRKVELTEAGRLYFARCEHIVTEAHLANEQLGRMLAEPTGVLRASLPVDFATVFVLPLLVKFADRYPGIQFEFDLTPRHVDLVSEPFDVAIRMGEPANSQLIARPLARLPQSLYAGPAYLRHAGRPKRPQDLLQHECLRFLLPRAGGWRLSRGSVRQVVDVRGRFSVNSIGMLQRLAEHGQGIAVLADALVADGVARGTLERVLPRWRADPIAAYAITETRLLPAKTQLFIDFLREHMATTRTLPTHP